MWCADEAAALAMSSYIAPWCRGRGASIMPESQRNDGNAGLGARAGPSG
jgi:hypothetical protein